MSQGRLPSEPSSAPEPPGAELRTQNPASATLWLGPSPAFSLWRGGVQAPDRLRIETREGSLHELRLEPPGILRLGRVERVSLDGGHEENDLVYPQVASRLAATLRHDGVRWWLRRRPECSVPVQVGVRQLDRGDEAPLVHGVLVCVGGMRATFVDRRFVTPVVPGGAVDPVSGLLARAGIEQEVAAFLEQGRPGALVLLRARDGGRGPGFEYPPSVRAAVALHARRPDLVVGREDGTVLLLAPGDETEARARAGELLEALGAAGVEAEACGTWPLCGAAIDAGREVELALDAMARSIERAPGSGVVALRDAKLSARHTSQDELLLAARDARRAVLLFAMEDQNALAAVGPHVIAALEHELAAVVATHAGAGAMVGGLAPGVVAACVPRRSDVAALAAGVQCAWHGRPPVTDGKVELPRALSWEEVPGGDVLSRAVELAAECASPLGVLSALSGGLPFPIAGRVHAAIAASSSIERVKMLFDVLEGTWRLLATVLASAYFARPWTPGASPPGFEQMLELWRRVATREGMPLGTWRELARVAARAFEERGDPVGGLARELFGVKLAHNQTFEALSNLMQMERNGFAHRHYSEAKAAADLPAFEQMTRTFLRALRPLSAWTLVTVEKTEPDPYGEVQTVDFIDHTGPFRSGARRRIGLHSPLRLANVVYLARWREGLLIPLEPMMRRVSHDDAYDLFWMDHLPRAGACSFSAVVHGDPLQATCDVKRLPPLLRALFAG